jgi:hypothetical protein
MTKNGNDYQDGMAAGIAEAEAEEGDLMTTRVITGKSAMWVAGHRVGRSKVRDARYLASQRDVNHHECAAEAHDRSLPDGGGRPYDQPYDEHGFLSDKQAMAADGLLGCNDCGRPLFYCTNDEQYHHVDPEAECFLAAAWGNA